MAPTGFKFLVLTFVQVAAIVAIVSFTQIQLPTPIPATAPRDVFSEERATEYVRELSTDIGIRLVGLEGERKGKEFILNYVHKLQNESPPSLTMDVEVQVASGDYYISLRKAIIAFENITNIIVRLKPSDESSFSNYFADQGFLLSSHFDSGVSSPGAFDDGVEVAVMMEVMSNIVEHHRANKQATMKHPMYFMFNGAEECGLIGSYAFVKQHPWVEGIAAFLNLEAAGTGGKVIVHQTSNYWVINEFQKAMVHPKGNVVGQDIFQSGVIPSDTDFKIYYLAIPSGIDICFYKNGYHYHTREDNFDKVLKSKGSIQHMGDNVCAFTKRMIFELNEYPSLNATDNVASTSTTSSWFNNHPNSTSIYFDVLGQWMIAFSWDMARPVFSIILSLSAIVLLPNLTRLSFVGAVLELVWSLLFALVFSNTTALLMIMLQKKMLWYSAGTPFALGLFGVASIAGILFGQVLTPQPKMPKSTGSNLLYKASWALWTLLLALGTTYKVGSSFICAITCLFMLISYWIPFSKVQFMLVNSLPLIMLLDVAVALFDLAIPLMGRMSLGIADYVVASFVTIVVFLASTTLIIPYHYHFSRVTKFILSMTLMTAALSTVFYAAGNVPVYTESEPKRLAMQHVLYYFDPQENNSSHDALHNSYISYKAFDAIPEKVVAEAAYNNSNVVFHQNDTAILFRIPSMISPRKNATGFYSMQTELSATQEHFGNSLLSTVHVHRTDEFERGTILSIGVEAPAHVFSQEIVISSKVPLVANWSFENSAKSCQVYSNGLWIYNFFSVKGAENIGSNGRKTFAFWLQLEKEATHENSAASIEIISSFVESRFYDQMLNQTVSLLPNWIACSTSVAAVQRRLLL